MTSLAANHAGTRGRTMTFLVKSFQGGGIQRHVVRLARELLRHGYHPTLMVVDGRGPLRSQIPDGVELVDLRCAHVRQAVAPLTRELLRRRPPVLLASHRWVNCRIALLRRLLGQPRHLILDEQNPLHAELRFRSTPRRRRQVLLMRLTYPLASRLTACSQEVADSLRAATGLRQDVCVIHNGIDVAHARAEATAEPAHAWLRSPKTKLILGIGRLAAQKDFPLLVRALAQLPDRRCRLIILGEGPDRQELQALARRLGIGERIDLPGFVENPFAFLARCDAFVLSSRWEGFGNVIVEALACGTPVVATACPGGPREILGNGAFGRLVPMGDPVAMAAAIQHTLEVRPDRERLMQRATDFSIQNTARQYIDLIEGLHS